MDTISDIETVFEIKNLTFNYNDNDSQPALNNINLEIKKGEVIALVGCNGSGKTTLVKVLLELYKPTKGKVYFYGKPYENYQSGFINDCIGVFFQEFYLFHLPLYKNVGFGNLSDIENEDKIVEAINKGGASKIINKLPKGLKNIIGRAVDKSGAELSGGEKQRIAVSRSYMSNKNIMIFDEPAAMLDPIAEMEQFLNIKQKLNGKTAILISHRVGFARLADRIVVLEKGKIVEEGTHNDLMSKKGVYADFFNKQAKWYNTDLKTSEV